MKPTLLRPARRWRLEHSSNGLHNLMSAVVDREALEHLVGDVSWARLLPRDGDSTEEIQRKRRELLRVLRVSGALSAPDIAGWQQLT